MSLFLACACTCIIPVTAIETIDVSRNCDSRFNVNELGDVYLELIESFSGGKCKITVEKNEEWDNEYPRLCVDPVRISGCRVRIDVHNILLIEGYHDKVKTYEPRHEKTINVVSQQVRHEPSCTDKHRSWLEAGNFGFRK